MFFLHSYIKFLVFFKRNKLVVVCFFFSGGKFSETEEDSVLVHW